MGYEIKGQVISIIAVADVEKYLPIKLDSNGKAVVATANTDTVVGFTTAQAKAGEAAPVMITGVTMAIASAAIGAGAKVAPTAAGKMVTFSGSTGASCGVALEAASAAGDIIAVLIKY